MTTQTILLSSSLLIMLILLAILIAISFRITSHPKRQRKVNPDLKKIKDQINSK